MPLVSDHGLGNTRQRAERGTVALRNPTAVMDLPGIRYKVMIQRIDQRRLVLGVVLQHGKVLQVHGDQHGRRRQFVRLL